MKRLALLALCLTFAGPSLVHAGGSTSVGTAQGGHLVNGFRLPENNAWVRFYSKVSSRKSNFATLELAALLTRASKFVHRAVGGALLTIGDCSDEDGGDIRGHRSHNSGRDVDILFYALDERGRSIPARGFWKFNDQGVAKRGKRVYRFDTERNWWMVRALIASESPAVQYIFVSKPLREKLLSFAKKHGEAKEILRRARYILMQPGDALPHDDHFHVRIYCSEEDRDHGCKDTGARWRWVKK